MRRLALLCVLMGCVDTIGEPVPDAVKTPLAGGSTGGWDYEHQGRHMLGRRPDQLLTNGYHFRVSTASATPSGWNLSVTSAGPDGKNPVHLIATHAVFGTVHQADDTWFKDPFGNGTTGLVMNGPDGRKLRIRDVALAPGPTATSPAVGTTYFLDVFDPVSKTWSDYCDGEGGAFAVTGGFNARRIHTVDSTTISFICDDGVGKKCIKWGYAPGIGGPGNTFWDLHQACIQMANAAYCGGAQSGLPFTREETPIVIRDFRDDYAKKAPWETPALTHPSPFPGDPDTFYIEAAWRPGGRAPLCVSKLRWKSLPPNPCPLDLPDPRFDNDPEVKYCEEYTWADFKAMGVVLVNGSQMMDAPLDKWRIPATANTPPGDVISTVRGFHSTIQGESIPPPDFPAYTEWVGSDGMILRNLTGTLENVPMIPLYIQHDTKSTALALSDDTNLPSYVHVSNKDGIRSADFEGYAFPTSTTVGNLKLLKICSQGSDYNTTISATACTAGSLAQPMFALPYP